MAFLFSELRYEVAGKEVDMIRIPGIASWLKLLCSMNNQEKYSNAAFDLDNNLKDYIHSSSGKFSGCLPLSIVLGIFEDFNKVLVNVKQELILKRAKSSLDSILTTAAVPTTGNDLMPTITLESIQWIVPHIQPSYQEQVSLQKILLQDKTLQIAFRSMELADYPLFPNTKKHTWNVKTTNQLEKPRYIIFRFQTARSSQARNRADHFYHCKLKNLKVFLNSEYYPYNDMNLDFENKDFSKAYEMFLRFRETYYNTNEPNTISRKEYYSNYPLIVIDCSRQNESVKEEVVDIKIEIQTDEVVPNETTAYCLIIHDNLFEYT